MLKACPILRKFRCKKKFFIMSSVTIGMCFSVYTLVIVLIASVYTDSLESDAFRDKNDVHFKSRHHNRILQNSLGGSEESRSATLYKTKTGNGNQYRITEKTADRLVNLDNPDTLYTDDEDMYKLNKKKSGRDFSSRNKTRHLPQAIIIGVKKAGTRALLEYLRMHPKVKAPGPEPHFFDKNYKKGLNWYRSLMPEASKGQLIIEKTPSYFVTKSIPERVYKMSKKTKLILVFRDPVTRAVSDYTQLASRNPNVRPFEEMIYVNNRTKIINTSWTILKIGVYAQYLTKWLEYFPIEQIHFVSGENLIKNPADEIQRVQEFLGLDQYITADNFTFNHTKGFPCYRKDTSGHKWHCLNEEKGRQHPNIDPSVIKTLSNFYRPFNIKLYNMIGQDFGWT